LPVVRVDDQVWNWLKSHATPFEDTPNSVLRRLAGFDATSSAKSDRGERRRGRVSTKGPSSAVTHSRLSTDRDYVVKKCPDKFAHWWFQIYERKLVQKARRGDFFVVVFCDFGAPSQVVFKVPYAYLRENVLRKAKLEADKRYMFEVKKDSCEFVFHPGIRFDGKPFLVELPTRS
jgi:hypothetical protein